MAKTYYNTVGSVVKSKVAGEPDYIKFNVDFSIAKGEILGLETPAQQIASLEKAVSEGKLSGDYAEKQLERARNVPNFVRFLVKKKVIKD